MHDTLLHITRTQGSPESLAALRTALRDAEGPLRRPGPDGTITLSFVWLGDADAVSLQCGLVQHGTSVLMQRVPGVDVWVHEVDAPADTLVSYRFVVDDPFLAAGTVDDAAWQRLMLEAQQRSFADPHNPHRLPPLAALFGLDPEPEQWESILAMPDAPPAHWFQPHDAPAGAFDHFDHTSSALGDTRRITVYRPAGADPNDVHPLVVLLDGSSWLTIAGLPRAIDAAVAARQFAAPIVCFVHEATGSQGLLDRVRELSCNPQHASMLAQELIPSLRHRYRLPGPGGTVLGGASLGGLASVFTAMEHPDVVGNVLSVSGSFWYGQERDGRPEWLARRLADEPARGFTLYQQIGRLEDGPLQFSPGVSHLVANRHFRDVAAAKGHRVVYDELTTAHDIAAFRVALLRGLITLLPRPCA